MPGHKAKIPEDMLPFRDRLSAEEKKTWVAEWRRLVWHSPRYLTIYATVAIVCALFFVRFMPAWEIADTVAIKVLFGAGELFVSWVLAEYAAYGFSRPIIEARMAKIFMENEEA